MMKPILVAVVAFAAVGVPTPVLLAEGLRVYLF